MLRLLAPKLAPAPDEVIPLESAALNLLNASLFNLPMPPAVGIRWPDVVWALVEGSSRDLEMVHPALAEPVKRIGS